MAATLIQETDSIDVSCLSMLIYGPPGAWKTSIAQTASKPLTLDLDRGAHRSNFRKAVMRFDTWADLAHAKAEIDKHQTIVVDTVGRLLDMLTADIVSCNAKHGSALAGLTLQGYGVLKSRFALWAGQLRQAGKDLVFIAHEKEEKDGDYRIMRADITGGSYTEVMKFTDLVGYLTVRNGRRILDFNSTDQYVGKNAAGWDAMQVPNLSERPTFLADLIADAKEKIGKTSQTSAVLAKAVEDWSVRLDNLDGMEQLNGILAEAKALPEAAKKQVWDLIKKHADNSGWSWDAKAKKFVERGAAA